MEAPLGDVYTMANDTTKHFSLEDWERDLLLRLLAREARSLHTHETRAASLGRQHASLYWGELADAVWGLADRLSDSSLVPRSET